MLDLFDLISYSVKNHGEFSSKEMNSQRIVSLSFYYKVQISLEQVVLGGISIRELTFCELILCFFVSTQRSTAHVWLSITKIPVTVSGITGDS